MSAAAPTPGAPRAIDRRRLLNVSVNRRLATMVTLAEIQDMAHYVATSDELLGDLHMACKAAEQQQVHLTPKSIIEWLEANIPQLNRATATQEKTS